MKKFAEHPEKRLLWAAGLGLLACAACSRKPTVPDASQQPSPFTQSSGPADLQSTIPTPLATNVLAFLDAYRKAQDHSEKFLIIYSINELEPEQALPGLAILFRTETNAELRSDILTAVSQVDNSNSVAVAAMGLDSSLPTEVRLAAIQALRSLDDPAAVPALEKLRGDPNIEVSEKAHEAIKFIQTPHMLP